MDYVVGHLTADLIGFCGFDGELVGGFDGALDSALDGGLMGDLMV